MEDWLTKETFDFDVTASPVLFDSDTENQKEEDDEEVFFGPQTHKERCIATVVKEKELLNTPCELNPEEQAIILRESALVSLRIKHGSATKPIKSSPVAIVHPMKREVSNPNNTKNQIEQPKIHTNQKLPVADIKTVANNSKILQPRIMNTHRSSSVNNTKTKLPMSKNRPQSTLENSESLVDQASLYGLNCSTTDNKENVARRRSGIPNKKKFDKDPVKAKSTSNVPSLLPSALPSAAAKVKTSTKNTESKLKPMKAIPQAQLKFGSSRKSLASQGTPSKLVRGRQSGIASLRKESSIAMDSSKKLQDEQKPTIPRNSLVTPIRKTSSSRKSMVGRQILSKSTSNITPSNQQQTEKEIEMPKPEANTGLSHANIMDRYKKLCAKSKGTISREPPSFQKETSQELNPTSFERGPSPHKMVPLSQENGAPSQEVDPVTNKVEPISQKVEIPYTNHTVNNISDEVMEVSAINGMETVMATNPDIISTNIEDNPLLVELIPDEPEKPIEGTHNKALLELSPIRVNDRLDPFQTGETPPPLIEPITLEPEKPAELLLIEF